MFKVLAAFAEHVQRDVEAEKFHILRKIRKSGSGADGHLEQAHAGLKLKFSDGRWVQLFTCPTGEQVIHGGDAVVEVHLLQVRARYSADK